MNNVNFFNNLQALSHNRFALSALTQGEFSAFHAQFLKNFHDKSISYQKISQSNPSHDWYLIGTDGCHLCENSHALLTQTQSIYRLPSVHVLDVMDSSDEMIDTVGKMIPLLLTPTALLCYPFGVMDIVALCH